VRVSHRQYPWPRVTSTNKMAAIQMGMMMNKAHCALSLKGNQISVKTSGAAKGPSMCVRRSMGSFLSFDMYISLLMPLFIILFNIIIKPLAEFSFFVKVWVYFKKCPVNDMKLIDIEDQK
jgi:hypothetical protein